VITGRLKVNTGCGLTAGAGILICQAAEKYVGETGYRKERHKKLPAYSSKHSRYSYTCVYKSTFS
jgi:hypothetical protein